MGQLELCSRIEEVIQAMNMEGDYLRHEAYGNGHINDTFLVLVMNGTREKKYILQRMNHYIFKQPIELMSNITKVTEYMKKQLEQSNIDTYQETLTLVPFTNRATCYIDSIGCYWRAYAFVENSYCLDKVNKDSEFYECAVTFGSFQHMLDGFPIDSLYETITDFHNTPIRYDRFLEVVKANSKNRVELVQEEIDFVHNHVEDMKMCMELLQDGKLPLRVTHNDTKLNNVLFDRRTNHGLCVIDLDTVMPGLSIFDFGDAIRFGANTTCEDDTNLDNIEIDLSLFEAFTKGFLTGSNNTLTETEISMLAMGAKVMTLECGMRFLTDYLEGDVYFKTHRPNHNLDRCRNQFALVSSMEKKWDDMIKIVDRCRTSMPRVNK